MNDLSLIDKGNMRDIYNKTVSATKIPMKRYENFFDYISEEPISISVKISAREKEIICIPILRIRRWNNEGKCIAWIIYADERENYKNIILRKVVWNMEKDKKYMRKYIKERREEILKAWPTLYTENKYLWNLELLQLKDTLINLDEIIKNGFTFHDRENVIFKWSDMELLRLYDWGQIHNTWCSIKCNESVELAIDVLINKIEDILEQQTDDIDSMCMNYGILPEKYEKFYYDE